MEKKVKCKWIQLYWSCLEPNQSNFPLEGQILQQRYQVGKLLDKGNQGKVYEITDVMTEKHGSNKSKLVAKFSEDKDCLANEIRII